MLQYPRTGTSLAAKTEIPAMSLLSGAALARLGLPTTDAVRLDGAMLTATFLLHALGVLMPIMTLHVFDRIIPNTAYETLVSIMLCLAIAAIAELALRWGQARVGVVAAARYTRVLRQTALQRLLSQPANAEPRAPQALQIERVQAIDRFASFYGGGPRAALVDLPFSLIALALIWQLGGVVVAAPACLILGHFALVAASSGAVRSAQGVRRDIDARTSDFLSEVFRSTLTVKSWGLELAFLRR